MINSKNDLAWNEIFKKHNLLDEISKNGAVNISASDINKFREARLMTKFDHKSQLPKIFAENNLSILPISRGSYIIGQLETFHQFEKEIADTKIIEFSKSLESLDFRDITSEATAINCAYITEVLQDFTNEKQLYATVSGRMSSSSFIFNINTPKGVTKIGVGNSQVEIDGGFEGDNSLSLIEAKNYIADDFLVRQLYYPFKLWETKIEKQVRPIFLTYSNGIFHLREYSFSNTDHYNSIVLINQKKYAIKDESFNLEVLDEIINKTKAAKEPEIPFPQADSFERVVNLCELLKAREYMSKEEITQNYDFDTRQTDYYSNAGRYLGLIENSKDLITGQVICRLTTKGKKAFNLNLFDRQKEFITLILSRSVFLESLKLYLKISEMPDKESIVEIMKKNKLYNISSDETYARRASTVMGWLNWILDQIEE